MSYILTIFVVLGLASCSQEPSYKTPPKKISTPDEDTGDDDALDSELTPETENEIHPKLLFHGGGGMAAFMPTTISMKPAADVLVKLGVPSNHIHLITYPHTKNISDIKASVDLQLRKIFEAYPGNTRFDSIGHSLGLLASFISFAELGYLPKIRSIIGVAGVVMRQDEKAMPLGCEKGKQMDLCGDIFDKVIGPSDSPYILDLINRNSAEIQRINKCAIWSEKDEVLSPASAGVLPGGKSVQMPASWCSSGNFFNPCHLQARASLDVYQAMKAQCFNGDFN